MQTQQESFTFSSTMELHNEGVEYFEAKRYGEAVEIFSDVLSAVKTQLNAMKGEFATTNASAPFCHFLPSEDMNSATSNGFFLFKSPLVVNTDLASSICMDSLEKLASVTLYNLALSYHLGALEARNPRRLLLLQKALAFYDLSRKIQAPGHLEFELVLNMAIVNNIGHIYGQQNQASKAVECFQHILAMVMYVVDCGGGSTIPHLDGFIGNIQRSVINQKPSAPAA